MLGTLAKWLRIYGFDTFYANSRISDAKLLKISRDEDRVLISRDKELIQIARRENIKTIGLRTIDIDEQIKAVLGDLEFDKSQILSRCIICNSEVEEILKDEIKEKVPKKVFENCKEFWFCKSCNKIYWKGSHYEKMIEKIKNLG